MKVPEPGPDFNTVDGREYWYESLNFMHHRAENYTVRRRHQQMMRMRKWKHRRALDDTTPEEIAAEEKKYRDMLLRNRGEK